MSQSTLDSTAHPPRGLTLAWRTLLAALILVANKFCLNFFVDFAAADSAHGIGADLRVGQYWGFRFLATFAAAIAVFTYVQGRERLRTVNTAVESVSLRPVWLLVHLALFAPLALLSHSLYGAQGLPLPMPVLILLWLLAAAASVLALLAGFAPLEVWRAAARALGRWWLYAAGIALAALAAMRGSQMLWAPTRQLTFDLVEQVLRPMIPGLQADAATQVFDTGTFAVQVNDRCSGLEGAGLLLAFCCAWLVFFRKEYRFPRALIVIPAGLLLMFVLNVLRIAALILIGHHGYPDIALNGFHSQAGWIAFNAIACGIAYTSRYVPWLTRDAPPLAAAETANPTAAYLLPVLTILAAGMLGRAASGTFETWYPLRLVCVVPVIWMYRAHFRSLDWRCSWRGVAIGVLAFAAWMLGAHLLLHAVPMPKALQLMPAPWRGGWITVRVLASISTVPLAEELAYRGYLMRRLRNRDFESVRFAGCGIWPLLISSFVFGLGHGSMWIPGILVGLAYGGLLVRTGRFGESVLAHAITNALVAVMVLFGGQWQLW